MRILLFTLCASLIAPSFVVASSGAQHLPLAFDRTATAQKVVALTFDADLTPKMLQELKTGKVASWYNQEVIAVLRKERVPATLFLTGMWIETYPAVTRELSSDPMFELGNHSYSHGGFSSPCYGLSAIKESNEVAEVEKTDILLKTYAIAYVKYFRFPGLCSEAEDVTEVEREGYAVIGGDVRGGDGFEANPAKIISTVLGHVRPGSIVILHMHGGPNAPETAKALPAIIQKLRSEEYTFVKVSDLLKLSGR